MARLDDGRVGDSPGGETRRAGQTIRANSSFESRRPVVVRRTRPSTRSMRPRSSAHPKWGPSGPVPASRLEDVPLILPARPHGLRLLIDRTLEKLGIVANVQLELDAMASTLGLVEEGAGYTILCDAAVQPLVRAGRIKSWPIDAPKMTRQLMLATSTQRPTSVATRVVAKLIRAQVAELFATARETQAAE